MDDFLRQLVSETNGTVSFGGSTFREHVLGFAHAIKWDEPWIIGLLVFHFLMFIIAYRTRTYSNFQIVLFVGVCTIVYCAEYVNRYFARYWKVLGWSQNYFDPRGVFISLMFSIPLLLIAFFQMIYALTTSSTLLIQVKRKELEIQRRQNTNTNNNQNTPPDASSTNTDTTTATGVQEHVTSNNVRQRT